MSHFPPNHATRGILGDNVANVFERSETLCRQVAGCELTNHPLYIVPQSRLPADKGGVRICDGYPSTSLDHYIQNYIPDYRGHGPCMVSNDAGIGTSLRTIRF